MEDKNTLELRNKKNEYMRNWYRKKYGENYGKSKYNYRYTEEEINFIKDNYKTMSNLQISKKLNKSLYRIKGKIKRMKEEGFDLIRTNKELSKHRENATEYMTSIGPRKYVFNKSWRPFVTINKGDISRRRVQTSHFIWANQSDNLPFVPKGFVIHHMDGNEKNNDASNLFLMTKTDHNRFHNEASRIIRSAL